MALFGYDYSKAMTSGFNPWYHYGSSRNTDGYYDPNLDKDIWENNGQAESSSARVWRWTLDDLNRQGVTNPGDPANLDKVRAAYLQNVARLRRDIEAPENAARGLSWGNSGFAGYDRFLTPNIPAPGARPEDTTTRPPLVVKPAPAPAPAPPPAAALAPLRSNPGINGGLGAYTVGNSTLDAGQRAMLGDDPEMAYEYMSRQLGMNPDIQTRFSRFMQQKFSPLLQASLAASEVGDNSNYGDVIDQLISNFGRAMSTPGGSFFNDLRSQADSALQSQSAMDYLNGISNQQAVAQYLNQLAVARYAGANPMVQQSIADQLESAQRQYDWEDFQNTGSPDRYLDWLRKSRYRQYLPTR